MRLPASLPGGGQRRRADGEKMFAWSCPFWRVTEALPGRRGRRVL